MTGSLEDFSVSVRLFSLPARAGAVWQDGRTCRADSDALWIEETSIFLVNVLALLMHGKLDLKTVFGMSFTPSLHQKTVEGTSVFYLCL